jgi:hypothetical protein
VSRATIDKPAVQELVEREGALTISRQAYVEG